MDSEQNTRGDSRGGGTSGGGGGSSFKSSTSSGAQPPTSQAAKPKGDKPTSNETKLAAQQNAVPDDGLNAARFAAREKVVRHFYEVGDGLGQARADQDMGVGGIPPAANGKASGYGIDLSKPVSIVEIPPPDRVSMYVKNHGYPGNFLDPIGGQSGDLLGLNDDPAVRKSVMFTVPNTTPKQKALVSGNGPIIDDWTDTYNPVSTQGGGTQMTIDDKTKSLLTPQPQPW